MRVRGPPRHHLNKFFSPAVGGETQVKIRHRVEEHHRKLNSQLRQVFYTKVSPTKEGVGS